MPLRIVTDSTADLPPEIVAELGIAVVPLSVLFGDEVLLDGVEITAERFFRRLQREERLPTTSQPSPGAFRDAYERLRADGASDILSIHISSKLSGTLASAKQGAEGIEGVRIEFVDSGFPSLALGMGVIAAAHLARGGMPIGEVKARIEDQYARTHMFFVLDTLEFLRRGGRIGRARAVVGSLLQLKPILGMKDSEVFPIGRVRTRRRAIEDVLERVAGLRPIEQVAAVHSTTPEDLEYVAERLRGLAKDAPLVTGGIGPVIGVHAGPGLIGIGIVTAKQNGSPPAEAP